MLAALMLIQFTLVGNSRQAIEHGETLEVWHIDVTTSRGRKLNSPCSENIDKRKLLTLWWSGLSKDNIFISQTVDLVLILALSLELQHYFHLQLQFEMRIIVELKY